MSWLFGYKSQVPQMTEQISNEQQSGQTQTAGGKSGDQGLSNSEKKAMEAYRFDSSALERAADAAKTLEKSSEFFFIDYAIELFYFMLFLQSTPKMPLNYLKCRKKQDKQNI